MIPPTISPEEAVNGVKNRSTSAPSSNATVRYASSSTSTRPSAHRAEHSELRFALSSGQQHNFSSRPVRTFNVPSNYHANSPNAQSSASPSTAASQALPEVKFPRDPSSRYAVASNTPPSHPSPSLSTQPLGRRAYIQGKPMSEGLSPIYPDFASLASNYVTMVNSNSADDTAAVEHTINPADLTSPVQHPLHEENLHDAVDARVGHYGPYYFDPSVTEADSVFPPNSEHADPSAMPPPPTPEYEYLTSASPYTPYTSFDDDLESPLFIDSALLTEPTIVGVDDNMLLFGGVEANTHSGDKSESSSAPAPPIPDMSSWYIMESPTTPYLDDFTLPITSTEETMVEKPLPRRKSIATGTRKNITPDSLVPLDAPTQSRKYITPSATSKKRVPASFARKRARSQAFDNNADDDEDDDDDGRRDEPPGPSATELEQIEWKRRQNTLAARKSRKRKLEYQQSLEDKVQALTVERNRFKHQTEMLQSIMQSHGLQCPQFSD